MDRAQALNLHCVYAIYTRQKRGSVILQVLEVWIGYFGQEEILLLVRHGLDDELFVWAEEEKAAGSTAGFTSFEHTSWVALRVKWRQKYLSRDTITWA